MVRIKKMHSKQCLDKQHKIGNKLPVFTPQSHCSCNYAQSLSLRFFQYFIYLLAAYLLLCTQRQWFF